MLVFVEQSLALPGSANKVLLIVSFSLTLILVEGNLVKAMNQCRLEIMKKLIEP